MTLFERKDELHTLIKCYRAVGHYGGKIVFVTGEAGIGKTALINQFVNHINPAKKAPLALCDPLFTPRPLGPVRDLFAQMGRPIPPGKDEVEFYFEDFITDLSANPTPRLLVIEDLHWVDQRSLDWLQFVGRRISQLPLLLVSSYRDDDVAVDHPLKTAQAAIPATSQRQLALAPLSLNAVEQLCPGSPQQCKRLHSVTRGNPFYLTEILRSENSDRDVPNTIADVINARLNKLPSRLLALIELLACVIGQIPYNLLEQLVGEADRNLINLAVTHHLLEPTEDGLCFRHELLRRTAFNRQSSPLQRRAQSKILAALLALDNRSTYLDNIVHYAAETQSVDTLLQYAPQAAARAAHLGAHREAANLLTKAVSVIDQATTEQAAQVLQDWAYEAGLALNIDDQVIAARLKAIALWRQLGRRDMEGENLRWLSRLHWYRGESEIACDYIEQALAILEREPPSVARAKAYALRSQYCMLQDQMTEAINWAQKAIALARQFNDTEIRAHALNTLGTAKMFRSDLSGEADLRLSLELAHNHNLHEQAARVYTNLSECLIECRRLNQAQEIIEQGIAFDTSHDLDAWTFYLVGRKAQLRLEQNRLHEARLIAENVLRRPNQTLLMQMPATIILARSLLRAGQPEAQAIQQQALQNAEQINEPQYLVACLITELELSVLKQQPARGHAAVARLLELKPETLSHRKRGECVFWARLAGHNLPHSYCADIPAPFTLFLEGKAEQAAESLLAEQSRYLAGWSLISTGQRHCAARALELFRPIQDCAAATYVESTLTPQPAEHGASATHASAGQRSHTYGLTRKEILVLSLLVGGNSNAAIAEQLSRSRRTIENHVASIFAKLGCNNRLDALLKTQSEPWILPADPP